MDFIKLWLGLSQNIAHTFGHHNEESHECSGEGADIYLEWSVSIIGRDWIEWVCFPWNGGDGRVDYEKEFVFHSFWQSNH